MDFFFSHKKIQEYVLYINGYIRADRLYGEYELILATNRCKGKMFFEIQNQYNGLFWQCIGVRSIEACNCNKII